MEPLARDAGALERTRDLEAAAANEFAAVLQALEGLAGVDLLDATQERELARLRERPRVTRASRRRKASVTGA